MDRDTEKLIEEARKNPFRFFSLDETARIFGFGRNVMSALASAGAPIVGRRCNPQLLLNWIDANADKVGKVRGE